MELVEEGTIGDVREVHIWFKRGGPDRNALPKGQQLVPAELNWDAWLGPLPWRGYHPDWMAYAHWRETCSGGLGTFRPVRVRPFPCSSGLWPESCATRWERRLEPGATPEPDYTRDPRPSPFPL